MNNKAICLAVSHAERAVISERPADVVPRWRAFVRSLQPLRIIAHKSLRGPYDREGFLSATAEVQRKAAASGRIGDETVGLWRMEKIAFAYCRYGKGSLNDPDIPQCIQPISHVGLGIAATEAAGFSAERVTELIQPHAHPDYQLFPYESIGCLWAVYANKMFKLIFRVFSQTQIPPARLSTWSEFVCHFPAHIQRLLAHGYGRTLYFKNNNLGSAVREAVALDGLDTRAAVQGIAFAYAMLNHADLDLVLDVGSDFHDAEIAESFRNGLIYALVFWEWAFSGFLEGLLPHSPRQKALIEEARQLIATSRQAGRLSVFGVN